MNDNNLNAFDLPDRECIIATLSQVIDPEAGINIVDLGLIYDVQWIDTTLKITMTMTSPACPVGDLLLADVEKCLRKTLPPSAEINLELSFNPLWEPSMMSPSARETFGW